MLHAIPSDRVKAASFHPDWPAESIVALTTHTGKVLLHDASGAAEAPRSVECGAALRAACWHSSDTLLVAGDDCVLHIVRAADLDVRPVAVAAPSAAAAGEVPRTQLHDDFVRALDMSSDHELLASCGDDGFVRVWRLDLEAAVAHLVATSPKQPHYVMAVTFAPGSTTSSWEVALACLDGTVSFWRSGDAAETTLAGHKSGVNCVRFSPSGATMVSGADDGLVKVWDVESRRCLATLPGHRHNVSAVCAVTDSLFLSCSEDGTIAGWSLDRRHGDVAAVKALPTAVLGTGPGVWQYAQAQTLKAYDTPALVEWLRSHTDLPAAVIAGFEAHAVTGDRVPAMVQGGAALFARMGLSETVAASITAALHTLIESVEPSGKTEETDEAAPAKAPRVDVSAATGRDLGRGWCISAAAPLPAGKSAAAAAAADTAGGGSSKPSAGHRIPGAMVCVGSDNGFILLDLGSWAAGRPLAAGTKATAADDAADREATVLATLAVAEAAGASNNNAPTHAHL